MSDQYYPVNIIERDRSRRMQWWLLGSAVLIMVVGIYGVVEWRHALDLNPITVDVAPPPAGINSDVANVITEALGGDATDPNLDTDGDGLTDSQEATVYGTSAYLTDSDGDGLLDGDEVAGGTDPTCPEGEDCTSAVVADDGTDTAASTASIESLLAGDGITTDETTDPTAIAAEVIREQLLAAGVSEAELGAYTDAQLVELYQQVAAEQGVTETSTGIDVDALRAELEAAGVPAATLETLSDEELIQLYNESLLEETNTNSNTNS